ncbi:MAG TPA: ABC transporter substrate-binding protein [Actinomycetota bacterium]|nr:ABC transporter substrate-binding protein [Actinomycetota bacterium]
MKRSRWLVGMLVLALVAGACNGDNGEDADGQDEQPREITELTALIPFPSGVVFYPLFVAQDRGYFEEEGLSVTTEAVDGSGQITQQQLAGQAEVGLQSPGPLLNSILEGSDLVSVYTLFQSNVFSLQTLADSEAQSVADLEGTTVGVGTIEGGETPFVRAVLSEEAGLEEGTDYELLAVGDGGTAAVALNRGEISAYAAAFPDVAIMRLRGLELRNLLPEGFQSFFDSMLTVERSFMEENPEVVEGLGRAIAKATVWGMDNPEGVLDITEQYFPEEAEDREFTLAMLQETMSLFELPAEAEGRWGYSVPESVERYMGFLVDQGELAERVDTSVFVNDFVDAYNAFDPAEL